MQPQAVISSNKTPILKKKMWLMIFLPNNTIQEKSVAQVFVA